VIEVLPTTGASLPTACTRQQRRVDADIFPGRRIFSTSILKRSSQLGFRPSAFDSEAAFWLSNSTDAFGAELLDSSHNHFFSKMLCKITISSVIHVLFRR